MLSILLFTETLRPLLSGDFGVKRLGVNLLRIYHLRKPNPTQP